MMKLVRLSLLVVIAVLFLTLVVFGVASSSTGALEKAVLVAVGAVLLMTATRVRRLGTAS
jgi:multisubunit Na+/H+ antiporter MnhB subunit